MSGQPDQSTISCDICGSPVSVNAIRTNDADETVCYDCAPKRVVVELDISNGQDVDNVIAWLASEFERGNAATDVQVAMTVRAVGEPPPKQDKESV